MQTLARRSFRSHASLSLHLVVGGTVGFFALGAAAPSVSLTANTANFDARGGSVGVVAMFDCSAGPLSGLSLEVALPEGWSAAGTTGSSLPGVLPSAGSTGKVGWAYIAIPTGSARFSFTVDYPAGLPKAQVLTASTYAFLPAGAQIPIAPVDIVIGAPGQVPQAIIFPAPSDCTVDTQQIALSAVAGSDLPVAFVVVSGPATIDGNVLTLTGPGIVTVQAAQPGNSIFAPAPRVQQSFMVSAPAVAKS